MRLSHDSVVMSFTLLDGAVLWPDNVIRIQQLLELSQSKLSHLKTTRFSTYLLHIILLTLPFLLKMEHTLSAEHACHTCVTFTSNYYVLAKLVSATVALRMLQTIEYCYRALF